MENSRTKLLRVGEVAMHAECPFDLRLSRNTPEAHQGPKIFGMAEGPGGPLRAL